MRFERLYLVGFMGSGKTTVGPLLAELLGWEFVDLDREIERTAGRTVAEIFRDSGEPAFRRLESQGLDRVSRLPRRVVALGGGAYVAPENRALVERSGVSVHLETSLETVMARVAPDGSRPLFSSVEAVGRLFRERVPLYKMARVTVNTENLDPQEAAGRILRLVETL